MTNGLSLTQVGIKPVAGQAAFLPNQPIIHNCIVDSEAEANLVPGDAVTFASTSLTGVTVVDKAGATDTPCGVVVFNAIKSSFAPNDKVSLFPVNSFVYLQAGNANLTNGMLVTFDENGQVVEAEQGEAVVGYIGILWTQPAAVGDLVAVQIAPGSIPAAQ